MADGGRCNVAVLGFHKIGEPPPRTWSTWNYVPVDVFEGHLALLRDGGYSVLDVGAFRAGVLDPATLPDRAVVLTFDDGYRSMLRVAEPILARHGLPSILFVPTGFVGGTSVFDDGGEPEERICDWDELRELRSRGVAIESHGVTHRGFSGLLAEEQEHELRASKQALEDELQAPVSLFAFPFGDGGDGRSVGSLLEKAGYEAACLYGGGALQLPTDDRFRLARVPVGPDTDLERKLAPVL